MSKIKEFSWFLWGLPQNLIGFILFLHFHFVKGMPVIKYKDSWVVLHEKTNQGAVSLGQFIFIWSDFGARRETVIKHEYGHTLQSHILGPAYLLVIGIPSFIWNIGFANYRRENKVSYYSFWTEKWADELGEVERNL